MVGEEGIIIEQAVPHAPHDWPEAQTRENAERVGHADWESWAESFHGSIDFSVPSFMAATPIGGEKNRGSKNQDEITGLPIETNGYRLSVIKELGKAMSEGKDWAFISADADNLKLANSKYGSKFGDLVIRYNAAMMTQAIKNANLDKSVTVMPYRGNSAGDEFLTILLGLKPGDTDKIKAQLLKAQKPHHVSDPDFTFSISATMIDSHFSNEKFATDMSETKKLLKEGVIERPYDFYQRIKEFTDLEIKRKKEFKDIKRFPLEDLIHAASKQEAEDILVKTLGNTRVSSKLMEASLKFMSNCVDGKEGMMKGVKSVLMDLDPSGKSSQIDNEVDLLTAWNSLYPDTI